MAAPAPPAYQRAVYNNNAYGILNPLTSTRPDHQPRNDDGNKDPEVYETLLDVSDHLIASLTYFTVRPHEKLGPSSWYCILSMCVGPYNFFFCSWISRQSFMSTKALQLYLKFMLSTTRSSTTQK